MKCWICGKECDESEMDYEVGRAMAEKACFDALGHSEHYTPYSVCKSCASEVISAKGAEEK